MSTIHLTPHLRHAERRAVLLVLHRNPERTKVIAEARGSGSRSGAGYLRARVGGPRWNLQGDLRRLVAAGLAGATDRAAELDCWLTGDHAETRCP